MPNATHVLQPADVGLFSQLKSSWSSSVRARQMEHLGESLTKSSFPGVFKSAWDSVATKTTAQNAFRRTGLFPFTFEVQDLYHILTWPQSMPSIHMTSEAETGMVPFAAWTSRTTGPTGRDRSSLTTRIQLTVALVYTDREDNQENVVNVANLEHL